MTVSKAVQRLVRVLGLEEEFRRRELESAQAQLLQLELAANSAVERERHGRRLIASSVQHEQPQDRLAGLAESRAGILQGIALRQWIEDSSKIVDERRTAFLDKRVERRQAETLVEAAEARETVENDRRTQQSLDDWYLTRPPDASAEK